MRELIEELKPCPFCGAVADVGVTRVWCSGCSATVEAAAAVWSEEQLAAAWNRRSSPAQPAIPDAMLSALSAAPQGIGGGAALPPAGNDPPE